MVSSSSASYLGCAHCQSPPHQSLLSRVSSPSESYLGWRIPGFTSRLQGTEMKLHCWTNTVLGHPSVAPPNSTHSYLGSMGACSWPQEAPHQPEGEDEGDQGLLTWECSSCSLLKSWKVPVLSKRPTLAGGRERLSVLLVPRLLLPRSRETWGIMLFSPLSPPSYTPVSFPLQHMQPLVSHQTPVWQKHTQLWFSQLRYQPRALR